MGTALSSETIHGTTVAIGGRGVVICGRSGSGKSDLGLRLIDRGGVLVSDDYTYFRRTNGQLLASAPDTIRGRIEVRGIGIVDYPAAQDVPVGLIVELDDRIERMPEPSMRRIAGIDVPRIALAGLENSAPIKVELALRMFGLGVA
ncbi:HPr kinase/phosphatase C-terminal domain-containing protein [Allosphingosinicella flava]|uniref:HPr kinase/phosphatase C-terminal domain-containing protein n=1 Tax=Allosphingosinicella flava TaxID=2771430 RepID=A0A7T2LN45_9SPHN|nr:HPr kinase/phosphatase C-terminal domain-containing protein [Sphingosinicella flava]QPQ56215.1 HPr kinase/phosphatase C-terminal domain-containing protein [Sphingosinicella flava]